ncbi:hypothetical protein ADIWIN_0305 [Winogradskyella psychrotolerans RS-3]|uniref:Uncharacterized protein n=1 Tax=Winogradskyella psychrotolerans RS-3 TaxID=641526 RepID=S7VX37_9FLAO|nr:hypothetical protein ADIWIN_0305 [Winogradskyella psychrotolerans RS-3]
MVLKIITKAVGSGERSLFFVVAVGVLLNAFANTSVGIPIKKEKQIIEDLRRNLIS